MCLGIPGQIIQVADSALQLAVVDVCGVKREVNISLICQDDPKPVVFAMTIIDEEEAKQTQEALIAMSQLEHEVGDFLGLNQK